LYYKKITRKGNRQSFLGLFNKKLVQGGTKPRVEQTLPAT
jgi:hypothetical protein